MGSIRVAKMVVSEESTNSLEPVLIQDTNWFEGYGERITGDLGEVYYDSTQGGD